MKIHTKTKPTSIGMTSLLGSLLLAALTLASLPVANVHAAVGGDSVRFTSQTVIDAEGAKITGLREGVVGQNSDEAVTGNQLWTTNQIVGALDTTVTGHTSTIGRLTTDFGTLNATVTTQGADILNLTGRVNTEVATLNGRIGTEVANLSGDISALGSTVASNTSAIGALNTNFSALSSTVATQGVSIGRLDSTVASNTNAIGTLNTDLGALSGTVATQGVEIGNLDTTVAGHTSAIGTLNTDLSALSGTVATQGVDIGNLDTTVAGHTSAIGTLNTDLSALSSTVATQGVEIGNLDTTVAGHTSAIGTLNTDLSALSSTVATQGADIGNLDTTVAGHTSAIGTLNTDLSALSSTVATQGADIGTLGTTVAGHTSAIGTLNTDLSALSSTVATQGVEIGNLDTTVAGHTSAIGTLNTDLSALSSTVATQGVEIGNLDTTVAGHTSAIGTLNTDLSALSSTVTDQGVDIATLNRDIAAVGQRVTDLDTIAIKYDGAASTNITLRSGTDIANVNSITGLADVASGDTDQTKAVNIASAKVIAAEVASDAIDTHLDDAHKAIAFSLGATASNVGFGTIGAQAIGSNAQANSNHAIAFGTNAFVSDLGTNSVALGADTAVAAANSVALGSGASIGVNGSNSVALGANTTTDEANTVAVGNRTISQVAAVDINAANTDNAATTGQLHNAASSTAGILGGGATVNTDGSISGWSSTLTNADGTTTAHTNVANALTGLDTRVTGEVATLNTRIDDEVSTLNDRIDNALAHTGDITDLDNKIDQEIADRTALFRSETRVDANNAPVLDAAGNAIQDIHIGGNSLATAEVNGQQELFAQDASGNAIDINITNGSKLLVNGDEVWGKTAVQGAIATANDALRTELRTEFNTRIDGVESRVTNLETAFQNQADFTNRVLNQHHKAIQKLQRGISMAAALQTPVIDPGKKNAAKFGLAHYDGKTGLAGGYARRIQDSVIVNAEVATSDDFDEVIARAGVNYSW
ncbi:hemagglutinin-like protein [Opitutaceae bacterium TAV1]|nr:hemagglutinin-like protein [Opitutaceae bacterium TAV1]